MIASKVLSYQFFLFQHNIVVSYSQVIRVSGGGKMKGHLSGETLTFLLEQTDIPSKNPWHPWQTSEALMLDFFFFFLMLDVYK